MAAITDRQRLFLQTLATLAQGSDEWIDAGAVQEVMGARNSEFSDNLVDLMDEGLIDVKLFDFRIRLTEAGRAAL